VFHSLVAAMLALTASVATAVALRRSLYGWADRGSHLLLVAWVAAISLRSWHLIHFPFRLPDEPFALKCHLPVVEQ
jgi:apolipoprotein N-acyltransferase